MGAYWIITSLKMAVGATGAALLLMALEVAYPKSVVPLASRLRGVSFQALSAPITVAAAVAIMMMLQFVGWRGGFVLDLTKIPLQPVSGLVLSAFLGDLVFYWTHRFQHRFMWRFHAMHHATEHVNATSNFHSPVEVFVEALMRSLPSVFFVLQVEYGWILPAIVILQANYIHASTSVHFGPFRYVIGDNRFHRIHHSRSPAHFNRNFAAFSPIWDVIFGTAYFPGKDEWPEPGLADQSETKSVREWILAALPFRKRIE